MNRYLFGVDTSLGYEDVYCEDTVFPPTYFFVKGRVKNKIFGCGTLAAPSSCTRALSKNKLKA